MSADASDLYALSRDLGEGASGVLPAMRGVLQEGAAELKDQWRSNARETAGDHGRHYPNAITYETTISPSAVTAEIGPDPSKPQGGMSFEYGSVNQPAHLDGQRAADEVVPRINRRIDAALGHLLGEAGL